MTPPTPQTKTDRQMEDHMLAVAADPERAGIIQKARIFKRSWLELAEALTVVYDQNKWKDWGYKTFDEYCRKELHIQRSTATKLLGSFRFLKTSAPKIIERAREDQSEVTIPTLKAVDFVARAEERGAADQNTLTEIRHAAFEEGADAPALSRRYKTVAFPVSADEQKQKVLNQVSSTAKKLAALIAEPDLPVSHDVAAAVEEAIGRLLSEVDAGRAAA